MSSPAAKIRNFRDLDIWKLAMKIAEYTHDLARGFPKEELFVLSAQTRRAAISIASNMAEGFNRFHNKEYKQFLYIALGSCAELETHLELGFKFGYFGEKQLAVMLEEMDHEARMIRNLIKRL